MANQANLEATMAAIEANPDHWNQDYWHCGTSHCFAGFAEMLRLGLDPKKECPVGESLGPDGCGTPVKNIDEDATRQWLDLTEGNWVTITDPCNSLEDLRDMVQHGIPDDEDEDDWEDDNE